MPALPAFLHVASTYDTDDEVDLDGYAGSLAAYATGVGALLLLGRATGRELPQGYAAQDLVVGGVATHKLTRLLSRASVTSPCARPSRHSTRPRAPGSTSSPHAASTACATPSASC